jgi:large subunit ribosomal protein L20
MPRVKRGNNRLQRRKKILALAKGYRLTKSKLYRSAKESVDRALLFAYVGRKRKKRDFRKLWIVRIGAAARLNGLNYSQFMHGLKLANIELDRKVLADIAAKQPETFAHLAGQVKDAIASKPQPSV